MLFDAHLPGDVLTARDVADVRFFGVAGALCPLPERGAPVTAAQLFARAIRKGLNTICFTQARKLTELIHVWSQRLAPEMRRFISSSRAGFVPEERREIESALASIPAKPEIYTT